MTSAATRRATYDDVLAVPAGRIAQLVDGELDVQPRPAAAHALASSVLGGVLVERFGRGGGGPGGWVILDEPELHLGEDVLVPDIAGWRVERMPRVPREPFLTLAPDWVCEVLSPSTARLDRIRKMRSYQREGVGHVWLVDPDARSLEVHRLAPDGWLRVATFEGAERVAAEPFEHAEIDLARLWIDDEPVAG